MNSSFRMANPPHPASILREDVLPSLGLTVAEAARQLGIERERLKRLLDEREPVSPEMALRLEQWLGLENGRDAARWLRMQAEHDLWQARQRARRDPLDVRSLVMSYGGPEAFAEACRRQSRLANEADAADHDLWQLLDEASRDIDGWTA